MPVHFADRLAALRAALRLRQRLRPATEVKGDEARRWQQARAAVRRVLREAGIEDTTFLDGKVVVDIGPGALGFPDGCCDPNPTRSTPSGSGHGCTR